MSSGKRWAAAAVLVLLALVLNPWVVEAVLGRFALGAAAQKPSVVWNLVSFELLALVLAVLVVRRRAGLQIACVALLTTCACLTTYNATRFLDLTRRRSQPISAQVMLATAQGFATRQAAALGMETSEILYSLHEDTLRRSFPVPGNATLDTALGVDPHITELFQGKIHFAITLLTGSAPPRRLFFEEIDLSSPAVSFAWRPVSVDFSQYAGEEITLAFAKGFTPSSEHQPRAVYDLLPIDFMFWRLPQLRPRRLAAKPNVVLISLDTLRADHLRYMGYPRETSPHLDRLASEGTAFTTTVSQAPWTLPAHYSILTSTYPFVHGATRLEEVTIRPGLPTLASILREQGYLSAAFTGRGPISARYGFFKGFDFYQESDRDRNGSDVGRILEKALPWLRENRERSFFVFLHTFEPHFPYGDPYFVEREGIRADDQVAYRTALYDGDVRRADAFVGEVVAALERLDLVADTLLVVTSDHGDDLTGRFGLDPGPRHAHTLYDELLLVPLIFYAPGRIPGGKRIDHQVRLIDILPTILAYAELDEPSAFPTIQGTSLRGMIEGRDQTQRPAYSAATRHGAERESLRTGGYKYIHRLSYGSLSSSQLFHDLPLSPPHELYDLEADPGETVNLAQTRPELLRELRENLRAWFPER